jgi:ubiquinone/menaquinone biosynthesis C-methylase UbiE
MALKLYQKYLLPKIVHLACNTRAITHQREKIVPHAHGRVLEVGVGSGLNLCHYDPGKVSKLWGLDPSPEMIRMAESRANEVEFDVEFLAEPAEDVPLPDNFFDSIVLTYTLCTIPDADKAIMEMARVIKPGGELVFCEHGAAPDQSVLRWQKACNPLWRRIGGGCHLNRDIPDLIARGGFRITGLQANYIPGWRPASYNYWGMASR